MKLLVLTLLCAVASLAASWDGTRGPFEVKTVTTPGTAETTTYVWVRTTDINVTGVRMTLTLLNEAGTIYAGKTRTWSSAADLTWFGFGVIAFTFPADQIVGVRFTELRDGASH